MRGARQLTQPVAFFMKCSEKSPVSRIAMILVYLLSPMLASADASHYETSIDLEVRDAQAFLSVLNRQLDARLDDKVLADYAASLAVGNDLALDVDMYHAGIVFTVKYRMAKWKVDRVTLTFAMAQKGAAQAICQQMSEFSQTNDSKYSPKSCQYEQLERIET